MRILCILCLLTAAATAGAGQQQTPGALVRPDGAEEQKKTRCLKTCAEWGENCITEPSGSIRCHRVCRRFGEECFEEAEEEEAKE